MEIKFRGQRIDNNEWVYGYYRKNTFFNKLGDTPKEIYTKHFIGSFDNLNLFDGIFEQVEVEYKTIGQFIGVVDSNGKDIFLGDKVNGRALVQRSLDPNREPDIVPFEGIISYAEGCYFVKGNNGQCVFSFNYTDYELEVVGNEYEVS